MQRGMLAVALSWLASGASASPEATPPMPLGRLEITPMVGGIWFARRFSLRSAVLYGGELSHHFLLDHPLFVVGMFARVYGAQSGFITGVGDDGGKVDVIIGSAGASFGIRGLGKILPVFRAGSGFLFADATPAGFEVRGRVGYELAAGVRAYPVDWLVVRGEVGVFMHDNVPLGAGSGQPGNAVHVFPTVGIGVIR